MQFQHRHFVWLAETIAGLEPLIREAVAVEFCQRLRSTNSQFDAGRFLAAAKGAPLNGRDRSK